MTHVVLITYYFNKMLSEHPESKRTGNGDAEQLSVQGTPGYPAPRSVAWAEFYEA